MSQTMNVYEALAEAQRRIGAVGKDAKASGLKFNYRSIDALLSAAHPILADLGLIISPRVLDHETEVFAWGNGKQAHRVRLKIQYRIIAQDGSYLPEDLSPIVVAEGVDDSDKGPGKAHSYGLKIALGQLFSIPTETDNEATAWTPPPLEHASPSYIVDVLERFAALATEQQGQLTGWLASFDPDQPPAINLDDLSNLPRDVVVRLSEAINRAAQATGQEPFDVDASA